MTTHCEFTPEGAVGARPELGDGRRRSKRVASKARKARLHAARMRRYRGRRAKDRNGHARDGAMLNMEVDSMADTAAGLLALNRLKEVDAADIRHVERALAEVWRDTLNDMRKNGLIPQKP